jgi:hypothetical protein
VGVKALDRMILILALFVLFEVIDPGAPDVHQAAARSAVSHHPLTTGLRHEHDY